MQKKPVSPSITRILWTDYIAFFQAAILVVVWVIYLAWVPTWTSRGPVIAAWMAPYVLYFAIFVTVLELIVITWRVVLIKHIFRNGEIVQGRIFFFSMRRDRGRVEYSYRFKGQDFECRTNVHRTVLTRDLKVGDKVTLVVDRRNPKRAHIHDIYA